MKTYIEKLAAAVSSTVEEIASLLPKPGSMWNQINDGLVGKVLKLGKLEERTTRDGESFKTVTILDDKGVEIASCGPASIKRIFGDENANALVEGKSVTVVSGAQSPYYRTFDYEQPFGLFTHMSGGQYQIKSGAIQTYRFEYKVK